ncbi:MAG: hypothetical protein ABR981_02505 [Candidatus Micrarchaeaceae archaeon]
MKKPQSKNFLILALVLGLVVTIITSGLTISIPYAFFIVVVVGSVYSAIIVSLISSEKEKLDRRILRISVWSIIIFFVLFIVTIAILLFAPSPPETLGTGCVGQSGYLCQNPMYYGQTGGITVTVGQDTGSNWTGADFVFVPQGTPTGAGGLPSISFNTYPANTSYSTTGIRTGQPVSVSLPVNGVTPPVKAGTAVTGVVWAEYEIIGSSTPYYAQIATINIKAS